MHCVYVRDFGLDRNKVTPESPSSSRPAGSGARRA